MGCQSHSQEELRMPISPLRQRMIDDMTARHFTEKSQKDYIRCVKNLAAFIGRSPDTVTLDDLQRFRLHLTGSSLGAASVTLERQTRQACLPADLRHDPGDLVLGARRGVNVCWPQLSQKQLPAAEHIKRQIAVAFVIADRIPIVSMGYGRASAADGRIFPWVFNFPATYWSAASIMLKYIADQERGENNLKGKGIALLYLNNPYGREPIPILTEMAKRKGFELLLYPVDPPGLDQDPVWAKIERDRPSWLLLWSTGTMTQIAIAKAAAGHFPMNHIIGVWWASTENDVQLAGSGADGYLGAALQAPGAVSPVHYDILKYLYATGKAAAPDFKPRIGEVLYNRGLAQAMWIAEGITKAMDLRGKREVTASDVRDGLEALDLTAERIEELGFEGMLSPLKLSCSNHEGPGKAAIQQWDDAGKRWRLVSGFYEPEHDLIDPLLKADSEQYARENRIAARECP
jgi:branched-chain amino acid transport system substrate-binding protein